MMGSRMENKMQSRKSASTSFGSANGIKAGRIESPSRDRLIYVLSRLIGRRVEVHVKNGPIISGIFHTANADTDFEIVLKMAQVVEDGSIREQKSIQDATTMPQLMIIPSRELVQVIAKDLSLSDGLTNGHSSDKRKDLMIDSVISHSHNLEMERELAPWIPDADHPECPELENVFNGALDRNWDQFETNKTLFGVKSTFNEELYTTKLERGPQMKELEKFASRLAREIEGEDAPNLHQAEERGFSSYDDDGLDEESRYSAVRRETNDTGSKESEYEPSMEAYKSETFAVKKSIKEVQAAQNETLTSPTTLSMNEEICLDIEQDLGLSSVSQHNQLTSDSVAQSSPSMDGEIRLDAIQIKDKAGNNESRAIHDSQASHELEGPSSGSTSCEPSSSSRGNIMTDSSDSSVHGNLSAANEPVGPSIQQGGSTEHVRADMALSHPSLSPSSSCGSLSSEKSTLNPNAKEFKLNPNAKSFRPSSSMRLHAAASDATFYYPSNVASVPHVHSLPVGMGVNPSFVHQPVFYNPQAAPMQSSTAYIPPGGPVYGQQMIVGQPPQFYYLQSYPPEMTPKKSSRFVRMAGLAREAMRLPLSWIRRASGSSEERREEPSVAASRIQHNDELNEVGSRRHAPEPPVQEPPLRRARKTPSTTVIELASCFTTMGE